MSLPATGLVRVDTAPDTRPVRKAAPMPYEPPDPAVARVIAEQVLRRRGEYHATVGQLHDLFLREIPESPAAVSATSAGSFVRWARSDLGALGIAVRRSTLGPGGRRLYFRLVAAPGETDPSTPEGKP
ncbi:hypothetical protein [Micromonospora sp. NPDC005197]|uniref:hypothetical protein n=1 Tax=Micromonospora sp. NPDC005197 TaxID=3157020 RepID=UPI0033A5FF7A